MNEQEGFQPTSLGDFEGRRLGNAADGVEQGGEEKGRNFSSALSKIEKKGLGDIFAYLSNLTSQEMMNLEGELSGVGYTIEQLSWIKPEQQTDALGILPELVRYQNLPKAEDQLENIKKRKILLGDLEKIILAGD